MAEVLRQKESPENCGRFERDEGENPIIEYNCEGDIGRENPGIGRGF